MKNLPNKLKSLLLMPLLCCAVIHVVPRVEAAFIEIPACVVIGIAPVVVPPMLDQPP